MRSKLGISTGDNGAEKAAASASVPGAATAPAPAPALAQAVGGGMSWIVTATVLGMVATAISQVVMGWLLTKRDFGLFATAVAIYGFVALCRDAGASSIMVQRGKEYEKLAGPLLWMGMAMSVASALFVAGIAWPLAHHVYKDDKLFPLLVVLAISLPLGTPGLMLRSKMRLDLRFTSYSKQQLGSSLVRQGSMIVLAVMGFKAMSLAIPAALAGIYETVAAYLSTREKFWRRPAKLHLWPELLRSAKWVVFAMLANAALDLGPYFVMGMVLAIQFSAVESQEITGVFFFAYQITAQLAVLLGYGLQQVLFPALAKLNDEPARQRDAIVRTLHALMLMGSFSCLLLATVMDPIEKIVWRGNWNASVWPVVVLGVAFPWRITFGLTTAVMQAQGQFKRQAWLTLFEGAGLMGATAFACVLPGIGVEDGALRIAFFTGGWLIVGRLIVTVLTLRKSGVTIAQAGGALFPSWLLAIAASLAAFGAERLLMPADHVRGWIGGGLSPVLADAAAQGARLVVLGGVCTAVFGVLARLFLTSQLHDALRVAPAKIRKPAYRLLGLREEGDAGGEGA